jgi:hypothetical protein
MTTTDEQIVNLHRRGFSQRAIARTLGVSQPAIVKRLRKLRQAGAFSERSNEENRKAESTLLGIHPLLPKEGDPRTIGDNHSQGEDSSHVGTGDNLSANLITPSVPGRRNPLGERMETGLSKLWQCSEEEVWMRLRALQVRF